MTVTTEKRPAVVAQQVTERMRGLLTLLNLHFAGVILLGLVNLYLLANMAFAWRQASSQNEAALADQTVAMKTAEIAKKPLEGLDEKLTQATKDSDSFSKRRLPFAYSQVAAELGALTKKQGVKLTRVQYAEAPVLSGTAGAVTEVRMDASLSGDYRPLVLFINSLERDKMFFMIQALTLTGQQSGTVGLRLRLTSYLRAPVGAEGSEKDVAVTADGVDAGTASGADGHRAANAVGGGRRR
jgi:type IV pilus assembly protein PilO